MQPKLTCNPIPGIVRGNSRETQLTRLDPDTCNHEIINLRMLFKIFTHLTSVPNGAWAATRGNCQEDWTGPDDNFYFIPSWDIFGL